jgi:probable HAF family extracellular repeat protein
MACAVSGDGLVTIGGGDYAETNQWGLMWTAGSGSGMNAQFTYARAVSADGSIVAGSSCSNYVGQACLWKAQQGISLLGYLAGGAYSDATGISADGSIVVGNSDSAEGQRAFRWTAAGGLTSLGVLPGMNGSMARAISADGSTIVGLSFNDTEARPFRWTAQTGMQSLGSLTSLGSSNACATSVSADGAIIVGTSMTGGPFIWDAPHGVRPLKDFLLQSFNLTLTGWELQTATAISADGSTVIGDGVHNSKTEAWVARLNDVLLS